MLPRRQQPRAGRGAGRRPGAVLPSPRRVAPPAAARAPQMTEPVAGIPSLPRPDPPRPWWTGGQYSLVRVLLGTGLATWFVTVAPGAWRAARGQSAVETGAGDVAAVGLALTGALAALLFAAGIGDRASALTVVAAGTLLTSAGLAAPGAGGLAIAGVLLAHLATPPAPYGSWAARGRPDPSVGWAPGRGWWHAVWIVLALAHIDAAARAFAGAPATGVDPGRILTGALAIVLPVAALIPRLRAGAFVGAGLLMVGWSIGAPAAATPWAATGAVAFLVALLFGFDPAWVPGRRGGTPAVLFYDGACGLCHRAVRFVVAEDARGETFRFAPLQSGLLERRLDEAQRRDLPDSLVVLTADGRILTRAAAVRFTLGALGGWWTIIARLGSLLPRSAGDALYDIVARGRRRWFAAPAGVCPVVSPSLRQRFLDQGQEAGRKAVP